MLFYFQGDHCYSKQRFLHKSAIDGGWALDYPFSKIAKVNIGTIISSYFICLDGHGWTFRMYKYKLKLSTRKLVEKDHVEWKSCSGNEEKRWKHNAYNMPMMWNQQTNTEMDQNLILHIWLSGYHGFDPQPEPSVPQTWPVCHPECCSLFSVLQGWPKWPTWGLRTGHVLSSPLTTLWSSPGAPAMGRSPYS